MKAMDGTADKTNLGANAILGVSLAVARAAANVSGISLYRYINPNAHVLPVPLMNCLNGGKLTANELEIQEFIFMPVGATSYAHALQMTTEINEVLRDMVIDKYGILATNTGDEGGFATPMRGIWEPFEFMSRAVEQAGYVDDIVYAMDLAANSWFNIGTNLYELDGKDYDRDALITNFTGRWRRNIHWFRWKIPCMRKILRDFPCSPAGWICRLSATICL